MTYLLKHVRATPILMSVDKRSFNIDTSAIHGGRPAAKRVPQLAG
ncbi:hypothetical protein [Shewanella denitrificans]|nr:hypothetical protein [Shewanella denitrificans]